MIKVIENIIALFFLAWSSVSPVMTAEVNAVYGRITDEKTGEPILAEVELGNMWDSPDYFAHDLTDEDGNYYIGNAKGGSHLRIRADGYYGARRYFSSPIKEAETWEINVKLEPKIDNIFRVVVFYACETGKARKDWREWSRYLAEYETNLIAEYVRLQGIDDAEMVITPYIRILEGTQQEIFEKEAASSWHEEGDIRVIIYDGEVMSGCLAWPGESWKVAVRGSTLEQEIKAMEGVERLKLFVYCELAHEIGHLFGLQHCHGKTSCPMAQRQISYQEWEAQGKQLYYCDVCRSQLLYSWENRTWKEKPEPGQLD